MIKFGSYRSSLSDLIVAEHLGWNIEFAQTPDPDKKDLIESHFPEVAISSSFIPFKNVEVLSTCSPGPPQHTHSRQPKLDTDYLELALQCFELAKKLSSRWVVWETHPRFLSSNKGKDFGEVLLKLEELGYGFAYRVLDSQFFGVPQARRSLFLVGYSGDWRPPAGVLFEQTTAREYSTKDRKKSFAVKSDEDLACGGPFVLPYKVAHLTNLYLKAPRLPYLKELYETNKEHLPFVVINQGLVRHFSPSEAELLQGYEKDFTNISPGLQPFGYKKRLSILSNSGCIPVYMWLFNRIQQINELIVE